MTAPSPMPATDPAPRRPGWWYPYIFVAVFAVVAAVNGVMIWLAASTFTGLEADRPFERGQRYNALMAEEASGRDWSVDVAFDPRAGGRQGILRVDAARADRAPLTGLAVIAELRRPGLPAQDRTLTLAPTAPGRYETELALPLAGQWEARITARGTDALTRRRVRLIAPSPPEGE